jgi:hypothetical protein
VTIISRLVLGYQLPIDSHKNPGPASILISFCWFIDFHVLWCACI